MGRKIHARRILIEIEFDLSTSELRSGLPGHPRSVRRGVGTSCIYDANESNEKLFRRRCK